MNYSGTASEYILNKVDNFLKCKLDCLLLHVRKKTPSKTRSWWQLKGLHSEPPPQSQLHAKSSSKNYCENGNADLSQYLMLVT